MGNQTLIYKEKFQKALKEVKIHVKRMENAFNELDKSFNFPIGMEDFQSLLESSMNLAYADQIIYRFSKAQDSIGAKLFKTFLMYQGENIDKPFLDILNSLEKTKIVNVDEWFELREIRNEIAHDYEDNENRGKDIINSIYSHKDELSKILESIGNTIIVSGKEEK